MKQYRYIGESNSFLTKNKIYEIKKDNNFIDDIGCVNYLGSLLNENFKEIKPCSIVESVRKQLLDRSNVGLLKYGVTLDRDDLSLLDWLEHAKQEQMDSVLYLEKIIQELRKKDTWYNEEQTNKRMNVIGQNGNDGTHYETK